MTRSPVTPGAPSPSALRVSILLPDSIPPSQGRRAGSRFLSHAFPQKGHPWLPQPVQDGDGLQGRCRERGWVLGGLSRTVALRPLGPWSRSLWSSRLLCLWPAAGLQALNPS